MKKFFALTMALCMMFVFCACGVDKDDTDKTGSQNNASVTSAIKETVPKFKVTVTDADGNAVEGVIRLLLFLALTVMSIQVMKIFILNLAQPNTHLKLPKSRRK